MPFSGVNCKTVFGSFSNTDLRRSYILTTTPWRHRKAYFYFAMSVASFSLCKNFSPVALFLGLRSVRAGRKFSVVYSFWVVHWGRKIGLVCPNVNLDFPTVNEFCKGKMSGSVRSFDVFKCV